MFHDPKFSTSLPSFLVGSGGAARSAAGAAAPLGNNTKFVDAKTLRNALQDVEEQEENARERRRRNWRMLDASSSLLMGTRQGRVGICKKLEAHGARSIDVRVNREKETSRWGNLASCGNVWTCPVCSHVISQGRGRELDHALEWARDMNGKFRQKQRSVTPVMMTLTARHGKSDNLETLVKDMLAAKKRLFQSRRWRALTSEKTFAPVFLREVMPGLDVETLENTDRKCMVRRVKKNKDGSETVLKTQKQRAVDWCGKVLGVVVAFEVTHTSAGGWHPHFHVVVFVETSTEAQSKKLLGPLKSEWISALKKEGLYASREAGFRLDGAGAVGQYVTKFGRDASLPGTGIRVSDQRKTLKNAVDGQDWSLVAEMTAGRAKTGKSDKSGVTPWQLLEQYAHPDETLFENRKDLTPERCGALFVEFAQAFHGRQQFQWSRGLKDLVGLRDLDDAELTSADDEELPEEEVPATVSLDDWRTLVKKTTRTQRHIFLEHAHRWDGLEFWTRFEAFLGQRPSNRPSDEELLAARRADDDAIDAMIRKNGQDPEKI